MYQGILTQDQLDRIDQAIGSHLMDAGVSFAVLIDMAGNTITRQTDGTCTLDTMAFSALAAGNFAAVDAMAKLVGETEFSLLFHKGKKSSIHFSKVNEAFLLITMFDKDVSLGLVRLKVADTIEAINTICA
jgi:predicted regulator of Ras-like GTPase activity (Roadblock/LC7/MglB family)